MPSVRYSGSARQDLIDIWVWVAAHDADAADRALDRIEQNCARLRLHSKLGPTRPDIAIGARVLIIDRWLAFYRLTEDGVQIVRIVDGARDQRRLEWPIDEGTM